MLLRYLMVIIIKIIIIILKSSGGYERGEGGGQLPYGVQKAAKYQFGNIWYLLFIIFKKVLTLILQSFEAVFPTALLSTESKVE